MKRWQKAAILLVVTAILAAAARSAFLLLMTWHFFFVARCNPATGCVDDGSALFMAALWGGGLAFTAYFFFAFVWLFGGRDSVRDAARR